MDGQANCEDVSWKQDYKQTVTNKEESNEINIKITDLQTWIAKKQDGGIVESTSNTITDPTIETDLENDPKNEEKSSTYEYISIDDVDKDEIKEKISEKITQLDNITQTEVISGFTTKYEELKNSIANNSIANNTTSNNTNNTTNTNTTIDAATYEALYDDAVSGYQKYTPKTEISQLQIDYYKKMVGHKMTTDVTIEATICTSSDMTIIEDVDKFLALIKADSNGDYAEDGEPVKYLVKGTKIEATDIKSLYGNSNNQSNSSSNQTGGTSQSGTGTIAGSPYTSTTGKKYNLYIQGGSAPWAGNDYGDRHSMALAGCRSYCRSDNCKCI